MVSDKTELDDDNTQGDELGSDHFDLMLDNDNPVTTGSLVLLKNSPPKIQAGVLFSVDRPLLVTRVREGAPHYFDLIDGYGNEILSVHRDALRLVKEVINTTTVDSTD